MKSFILIVFVVAILLVTVGCQQDRWQLVRCVENSATCKPEGETFFEMAPCLDVAKKRKDDFIYMGTKFVYGCAPIER